MIAQYVDPSLEHSTKGYAKKILNDTLDEYWKYVSTAVKQHFNQFRDHLIFKCCLTFKQAAQEEVEAVDKIGQTLGSTALLRLKEMRTQHSDLSASTMASRLLTKYINDLAQEHGLRQKLEHNHDWAINFSPIRYSLFKQTWAFDKDFDDIIFFPIYNIQLVLTADTYRQQSQTYYQTYPVHLQVRLNPNELPRDIVKQFRRYFKKIYNEARMQLLSE